MMHRLAIGGTLGHGAFATTTAEANTVDDVPLTTTTTKGVGIHMVSLLVVRLP
jgi:hypothetical protein